MTRKAEVTRTTTETSVTLTLTIEGEGNSSVETPVPFLTHMLELFARHGLFDLTVKATGDTDIDDHHLVEDIGICLGDALTQALGDKKGITRFGSFTAPLDEALAEAVLDLSGRPYLVYDVTFPGTHIKTFSVELVEDFFQAIAIHGKMNIHITQRSGRNLHHMCESIFKAFARALDSATRLDPRVTGVPSTKGSL